MPSELRVDVEIFHWSETRRLISSPYWRNWLSHVHVTEPLLIGWYFWLRNPYQNPTTSPVGPFECYSDARDAALLAFPVLEPAPPTLISPLLMGESPPVDDPFPGLILPLTEPPPSYEPEAAPSLVACSGCASEGEDDDYTSCMACGDSLCEDCTTYCLCGGEGPESGPACRQCFERCQSCDCFICADCACGEYCPECGGDDEDSDISLEAFSKNPRICCYETSAEWTFHKEPWENTLYLGIELEIEFEDAPKPFFDISIKHFPNKHLWKYDGSIGPGGELVITPHTLQALRRVNIKEMLEQFSLAGATSYQNGRCGLHVHVNRDSVSQRDFKKLTRFFVRNEDWLIRFCQRTKSSWNQYCGVPKGPVNEWGGSRYVALNRTSETVEFRIFRGTLDYGRFKASLEFTQAIIEFVKCHSFMTCDSEYGLSEFLQFVRPRYHILTAYIAKRFGLEGLYYPKLTLNQEC